MDDALRELYQEVILDHGKHPRNFGEPEDANRDAFGNNPLCGDRLHIYLKVGPGGVIENAAFDGRGCAISVASASMMTGIVKGKTVDQAERLFAAFHKLCTGEDDAPEVGGEFAGDLDKLQVLSGVRQFPMRVKCATLAWHTMDAAVKGENETTTE
jgi:nitrogen fixation NifU-like protein